MKGLATSTVVLILVGVIVMLFALYFLYISSTSNRNSLGLTDCKSIFANQCGQCIAFNSSSDCFLGINQLNACRTTFSSLGIVIGSDGSFNEAECQKLGLNNTPISG